MSTISDSKAEGKGEPVPGAGLPRRCEGWAAALAADPEARAALAGWFEVPEAVLDCVLGLGYRTDHPSGSCWTFPLSDAGGNVVGVWAAFRDAPVEPATTGAADLFIPGGWKDRPGPLYLVHGVPGTLALTTGGCAAIGRPALNVGIKLLAELIRAEVPPDRELIWLGENDRDLKTGKWPGRDESRKAAATLAAELPEHKVYFSLPPNLWDKNVHKWATSLVAEGLHWSQVADRLRKGVQPERVKASAHPASNGEGEELKADGAEPPAAAEVPVATGPTPPPAAGEPDPPLLRAFDPAHLAKLRASGLTNRTVNDAGLLSESDADRLSGWLGWANKEGACRARKLGPCLVFPHWAWGESDKPARFVRLRPNHPRADGGKYEQPKGVDLDLYIPRQLVKGDFHQSDQRVLVTEGELKALCATQHGFPCVSVPGVFCGLKKGTTELRDGLAALNLDGREVVIVFDSDVSVNPKLRRPVYALQEALKAKGAVVKYVVLLPTSDGGKVGLDDYLVDPAHGPDALRNLIENAHEVPKPADGELRNYEEYEVPGKNGKAPKPEYAPRAAGAVLADVLAKTGGQFPVAVGNVLYAVAGDKLRRMPDSTALTAWLHKVWDHGPTPRVRWMGRGPGFVPQDVFFDYCLNEVRRFDATSAYPHCPPVPTVLYAPYALAGGDGSAFDRLIEYFGPASVVDEVLLRAAFATPLWGGLPGKRPAFLFAPDPAAAAGGRQTGKTSAAQKIARLYGGSYSLSMKEDFNDFTKRLLNSASDPKRVVIHDNAKTQKLSRADLEAFITEPRVNGHQFYTGDRDVPNLYTVIITINGGTLSCDMALRSIPVHFATPAYYPTWDAEVDAFIDTHRAAIFGDIAAALRMPVRAVRSHGRFPEWESEVLSRFAGEDTDAAIDAVRDWQNDSDGDREAADHLRESVARVVAEVGGLLAGHLRGTPLSRSVLWFTADAIHQLVNRATGKRHSKAEASSANVTHADAGGAAVSYAVATVTTPAPNGAARMWWACPACAGRVGMLYLPAGRDRLGCRGCCGLGYASQYPAVRRGPIASAPTFTLTVEAGYLSGNRLVITRRFVRNYPPKRSARAPRKAPAGRRRNVRDLRV
jgi:hypothetical protein